MDQTLRTLLGLTFGLATSGSAALACFGEPDYAGQVCEERSGCPAPYRCVAGRCSQEASAPPPASDAGVVGSVDVVGEGMVTGVISDDHLTEEGVFSIPTDMRNTELSAMWRDPSTGAFQTVRGAGTVDGRFVIPRVPAGEVYIRSHILYIVTSGRALDLGQWRLGRPNLTAPTLPTQMTLMLGNLDPWVAGDSLHLFTPNAASFNWFLETGLLTVAPGDTTIAGTFDYGAARNPFLVDSSLGDVSYVTQLVDGVSSTGAPISLLRRVHVIQGLNMVDGQSLSIAGQFEDVPLTKSLQLAVCGAKLGALGSRVHPTAVPQSISITVSVNPVESQDAVWEGPRLFGYFGATSGADADLGTVTYGNPYPPRWPEYASVNSNFLVSGSGPLAGRGVGGAYSIVPVGELARIVCEPRLTPPTNPKVNGLDAFVAQTGVGEMPVFSWGAPKEGASVYLFNVQDGETGAMVAAFRTASTDLMIPPGLLLAGKTYFARLVAVSNEKSAAERLRAPFRSGLYYTEASTYVGPFTP